jgi:hypothetical protein
MILENELTIRESKRTELVITEAYDTNLNEPPYFYIKEWNKKSGHCTDTIFLSKVDLEQIKKFTKGE